ncbi:MAG TPA: acyl-CoA dehydrogenase family protein [Tepidisphaeraceae bacterium]|jgi:alkylation response protein AidB-like acyl-CoA dehydrogenase|nr:acyl-CoA dehydrogenase family protein [Tepidisphaeraceae bacterium]
MPTFKKRDLEEMEKAKDLLEGAPAEMGFVKSLFFGRLKLDSVMPYPTQDPGEARRTDELIARLTPFLKEHVDADKIDAEERIPQDVIDGLAQMGVLGMTVPTEYGGGGFTHTAYCRVLEHISQFDASTAVLVGAHQSIGLKALMLMGTEEQKRTFLPDLAAGRKLAAFCLSEPEVGSDAANVQTRAVLNDEGTHYLITGEKKFATNAAIAGMLTVMARTPVIENGKTREKVTAFLVTPDLPGFEIVKSNRSKMGVRGSWQGVLKFTDMPVPKDRVLGEVGKGLKVALGVLNYGRCTLSAGCVGGAKRALELALQRAKSRTQFSRKLCEFHLVKQKIANMAQTLFAVESLTYLCAGLVDRHEGDIMLETAISKLFCSEALWQVSDDCLQIWGGEGYMRSNGIERMVRDARINRIVEGATEVMSAFIALAGMKGVGEEFESVMRAAKHPIGNFGRLARFAGTEFHDVMWGHGFPGLHAELADEGKMLASLTTQFARDITRLLAKYKETILDYQMLQDRLAWSAAELYASAAVISRLQKMLDTTPMGNGHDAQIKRDLKIGKAYCHRAAASVKARLRGLFRNQDEEILEVADLVLDDAFVSRAE